MTWIVTFIAFAAILYRVFSKQGRERARLNAPPLKVRLYVAGVGFSFVVVFTALNILGCYLHRVPIPGIFWFALVGGVAATALVGRALIRLSASVG